MSDYVEVMAVVEGDTEKKFITRVLAPYLGIRNIYITAAKVTKPGQKGGDVRFSRISGDIGRFLKQRSDIFLTMFIDFYGISEWPEYDRIKLLPTAYQRRNAFLSVTMAHMQKAFPDFDIPHRFIPYVNMHEFEALLFSDPAVLAGGIGVETHHVEAILSQYGTPEEINHQRETTPSHRLEQMCSRYKKTVNGISIAEKIGIDSMRYQCPGFNDWLNSLEGLCHRRAELNV